MKYIFAGDRDISVWVLKYLIDKGFKPEALMITEKNKASHAQELIKLSALPSSKIFEGNEFKSTKGLSTLSEIKPNFIFGIHFPYLIPKNVLEIPRNGFLNLHPAYLPFNRGWHTPSWAIIEKTPIGATLHFMEEKLDAGDIIHQKEIIIEPNETANSLYQRLKLVEFETFKEAFPKLIDGSFQRTKQDLTKGTSHVKKDLFSDEIQKLDLDKEFKGVDLIDKLRALTTNNISEAAYFINNGRKYHLQIKIEEEVSNE